MIRVVRKKIESWREEPESVRLRIVTLLTAGTGVIGALLWLFVLLPLQLHLGRPEVGTQDDATARGVVSGVQDVATPSPTPSITPEVKYYHGTQPSLQDANSR